MIYYFDIHRTKVFGPSFRDCGVIQKNPVRGLVGMSALHSGLLYGTLPSSFFYPKPVFKGDDDKIIVFDTYASSRLISWLSDTWPDKRVIHWYWNPVYYSGLKIQIPKRVEMWSFSKTDCAKYGMRYNTQFFFDCYAKEAGECGSRGIPRNPRALFIGRDKGRMPVLEDLKATLEGAGVEVDLRITKTVDTRMNFYVEKLLPYRKVIDLVKNADILLDYSRVPDAGLSLRPMEALFFGKKLITNNLEILDSDFYNPANIYVLDRDKRTIKEFVDCPVEPVDPLIRDNYLLSNWLKRF